MLKSENLILRTIEKEDLHELFTLCSDLENVGEFWHVELPTRTLFEKKHDETGFWGEHTGNLVITSKSDGRILGKIGFFKSVPYMDGYEIGYRIFNPDDRGKGIMSEALARFCSYMFEWKNIARLEARVMTENVASRRVAEKVGFKHEGTMRNMTWLRGRHYDMDLLALLREDVQKG